MRYFLLGTDWWTDCDDAVALRLLCRFIKQDKVRLLGIGINACMPDSVASVRGFLRAEGVEEIPLGIDLAATDFDGEPPYQRRLAEDYAPELTNADAEDAVRLYRRLLSEATEPIEIVEIGYPQVLAALLQSEADDISRKSGLDLVREHVAKFWVMAGKWDADGERENNFCSNARASHAAHALCKLCPVPITFLGWEVGWQVITGDRLHTDDHLYRVLCDHGSEHGRHSWDPMLMMLALIGDAASAEYDTVRGTASVDSDTGANHFVKNNDGLHTFVVKKREDSFYEQQINAYL